MAFIIQQRMLRWDRFLICSVFSFFVVYNVCFHSIFLRPTLASDQLKRESDILISLSSISPSTISIKDKEFGDS